MAETPKFELLGHYNPLGHYPSILAPVGKLEGELMTVFWNLAGTSTSYAPVKDVEYIEHQDFLKEKLIDYDPTDHLLYGLSETDVRMFKLEEEVDFYKDLLSDADFAPENPFSRLSAAHSTGDKDYILNEIKGCMTFLLEEAPEYLSSWYRSEMDILRRPKDKYGYGLNQIAHEFEDQFSSLLKECRPKTGHMPKSTAKKILPYPGSNPPFWP
jgi:hypothetical protein